MAVNGDQANHLSTVNKSVKKMKKRKELDALLTGSNGKAKHFSKPSNKPSKKDGHELLIPDESDSLDSSDNDFFGTPKKTIVRKPRPWPICATCIPLCIFVLTLACIVVTTGLIWMHMELKQDMDDLRDRLTKVESDVQTSQTQAATVSSLENKLEKLQGLIINNQQALTQLKTLNQSINDLKGQVKAVKSAQQSNTAAGNQLQLQQEMADLGNKVTSLEEMKNTVNQLQNQLGAINGKVDGLENRLSSAHPAKATTASHIDNGNIVNPIGSPVLRPSAHDQVDPLYVHQELQKFDTSVDDLNTTINSVKQYQQSLDTRLTLLEAIGTSVSESHLPKDKSVSGTMSPQMMTVFTKIHEDVNTLMNWYNETQLHTPTDATNPTVSSRLAHLPVDTSTFVSIADHEQWEHYVNNTLKVIETKLESISIDANTNYTSLIKQSLDDFIKAYHSEMESVKEQQQLARGDINTVVSNLLNVQQRFTWVYDRIAQLQQANPNLTEHETSTSGGSISTPLPFRTLGIKSPSSAIPSEKNSAPPSERPAVNVRPGTPTYDPYLHKITKTPYNEAIKYTPEPLTQGGQLKSRILSTLSNLKSETQTAFTRKPFTQTESSHNTRIWDTPNHATTKSPKTIDGVTSKTDLQTTADGLRGPEWQPPLDIFQPTPPATVKFPNVNDSRDLQNKFSLWDKNGDGLVIYSDLPDFMGPFTPPEEALVKFDANKDGKYDLEELLHAAGYMS